MRICLLPLVLSTMGLPAAPAARRDAPPAAVSPSEPNAFDQALARAKQEKKYLFVIVLSREDETSRRFDEATLKAPEVVAWMQHKAVLLRLYDDEPIGRNFATTHGMDTLPTLVILASDGRELGRQVGFASASRFLIKVRGAIGSRSIRGKPGIHGWSGEDVVVGTMKRAAKLTAEGKYADALEEYQWCFEHRATRSPVFPVTHLPDLVDGFVALAKVYEPAGKELERKLAKAAADSLKSERPNVQAYYFLKYAYVAQGREDELVRHYDRLRKRYGNGSAPASFARLIYEPLLHARRYEALRETVADPESVDMFLDEARQSHRSSVEVRRLLANRYEILLGLGETRDAKEVERKVLAYDQSAGSYLDLASAALRSGRSTDEHILLARKAHDLFGRKNHHATVVLARLLAARRPRDAEALRMLRDALEHVDSEADRREMEQCIEDIRFNRVPLRSGAGQE